MEQWVPLATDYVVLVLGQTGSGKSTFINAVARREAIRVYHGLAPGAITMYPISVDGDPQFQACLQGRRLVLVEAPGFNHLHLPDATIWEHVKEGLRRWYGNHRPVDALVYLHDITQNRIQRPGGEIAVSLEYLLPLLGHGHFRRVIIATTQWNRPPGVDELGREEELKEMFLKPVLDAGARFKRVNEPTDARTIFNEFVTSSPDVHETPRPLSTCIILLLGETGSGKSTFLNHLAKKQVQEVGHELISKTKAPTSTLCAHQDVPSWVFQVVDTPGFNNSDERMTDGRVWEIICNWLESQNQSTVFGGILYFDSSEDKGVIRRKLEANDVIGKRLAIIPSNEQAQTLTFDSGYSEANLTSLEAAVGELKSLVKGVDPSLQLASIREPLRNMAPARRDQRRDFWAVLAASFRKFFH